MTGYKNLLIEASNKQTRSRVHCYALLAAEGVENATL